MRALALLPLLAATTLAGCSGGGGGGGTDPAPSVVTDPRDTGYLLNMTPGSHVHDYWQGRTEVLVVENTTGTRNVSYGGDHGTVASWIPPDGSIVPQGTGQLEAVIDWTEATSPGSFPIAYTHAELHARTAADDDARPVGRIERGQPLRFNATKDQADPPHYVLSLWEFKLVLWNEGGSSTSFSGTFSLRVTAFRTLPLEPFPPHPDLWGGKTELPLAAFDQVVQVHMGLVETYACLEGCADVTFAPDPGVLVPYDGKEVVVTVRTDTASTPVAFGLDVHGADTRTLAPVAPESDTVGQQVFRVPLDGRGDSPYAKQSLWEFRVHPGTPREAGPWSGTFHVEAVVLRA